MGDLFFSSRRRHTRWPRDWSSDVCSSDLVADVDDENVVPGLALTIYQPVWQMGIAGRLFVRAAGDPYALVPAVTRVIREISAEQPVEHAATLEDVQIGRASWRDRGWVVVC